MGPRGFLPLGRGAQESPRGHVPVPEACGHGPASLPLGWARAAQDHLFIFGPLPWRRGGFEMGFHQQQRLGERRENNAGGEKSSFSWAETEGRGRDPATEPASRPLPPPAAPILLPSPTQCTISARAQPESSRFGPIVPSKPRQCPCPTTFLSTVAPQAEATGAVLSQGTSPASVLALSPGGGSKIWGSCVPGCVGAPPLAMQSLRSQGNTSAGGQVLASGLRAAPCLAACSAPAPEAKASWRRLGRVWPWDFTRRVPAQSFPWSFALNKPGAERPEDVARCCLRMDACIRAWLCII